MPARRAIVIAAGVGFTDIPVSIAAHRMTMQMSDPTLQIDYQTLQDSFAATQSSSSALGHKVAINGPGSLGTIGKPADFIAVGHPATATVAAKVRTSAAAGGTLIVEEFEGQGFPS